jgi:hypothetical protein
MVYEWLLMVIYIYIYRWFIDGLLIIWNRICLTILVALFQFHSRYDL